MASRGLFLFLSVALAPAVLAGFSADLIHRDSAMSPLHNTSATLFDRWLLAAERSHQRARHFASRARISPSGIVSPVAPASGSYLMKLSLGTPPFDIHAIADTGSDLTWTNCVPCTDCYRQKDPLFDPAESPTYANVTCGTDSCNTLPNQSCDSDDNCQYRYAYGDGSTVTGLLAMENFTFASTSGGDDTVSSTLFGCSHESKGTFDENVGGLVGLGGGELSLVSQLGDSIDNQFSYCLLPYTEVGKSSTIVFGPDDNAPRGKIPKTPIIKNPEINTFYYLTLHSIIVGESRETSIPVAGESSDASSGNIIIDSGTTLTILQQSVVDAVAAEVKKVVTLPPVDDPKYEMFGACFGMNGTENDLKFPEITFAFDGADVPLKTENMLVQVDDNVLCLALASAEGSVGIQIYGNVAQQGFYVGYDLGQQQLSIAPANCTDL